MDAMRGHDQGTIYFRGDRKAKVAAVRIAGSRHTIMCPHRNHKRNDRDCRESQAALARLIALRDAGTRDPRRVRLGPFLERWLDVLTTAPATRRQHERNVRVHINPVLGHLTLADLDHTYVDRMLDELTNARNGEPLDGQTKRHVRATLRVALNEAVRDGTVTRNAAALARPPKMGPKERVALDAGQVRRLIEGSRDDRYHALYVLCATVGLRLSEALGLAWSDVDFDGATLRVRHTLHRTHPGDTDHDPEDPWVLRPPKTAKSRRTVPLTPVALAALRTHRERQDEERGNYPRPIDSLVFLTPTGLRIHGSNMSANLRRTLVRLGLPVVTCHDLRHSAATVMFAAGVPLPVIADILGHSTVRVTADLYRHHVEALSRDAADRMQGAVG